MPFYLFAWVASFAFGFEVILSKLTSKYGIKNPWVFNFVWRIVLVVLIFPVAYLNGLSFPSHWLNIFYTSIFDTLFSIFYVYCLFKLDVSVVSPLFNFRTVFALILGVLMLGEKVGIQQYPFILLIIIAGFFVTYDEKFSLKSFFNKNVLLLVFAMFFLAMYSIFLNRAIAEADFWNATFWNMFFVIFLLLPTFPFFKKEINKVRAKQVGALFFVSLASVTGVILSNVAFAKNVGTTSVIMSIPFSMILAVILAFFLPKLLEKHTKKVYFVRLLAASVMIFSALKLSM